MLYCSLYKVGVELTIINFVALQKGFVIFVFLTRIATVDVALWYDTRIVIIPCDSQLWAIQLQEHLNMLQLRAGSLLQLQISAIQKGIGP